MVTVKAKVRDLEASSASLPWGSCRLEGAQADIACMAWEMGQ